MVADAIRAHTIAAASNLGTWCVFIQSDGVHWGCSVAGTGNGSIHIVSNLIHAGNDNDVGWSENEGSHPVTVAVNIDQFTAHSQGIGTHKIVITDSNFAEKFFFLFIGLWDRTV